MVIQARLRVRLPGAPTSRVPGDARIIHMSGDDVHCLSVYRADTPEHLAVLMDANLQQMEPDGILDHAGNWAVARCHCPERGSLIVPVVHELECSIVWPVIEHGGVKVYQILAPSRKRVAELTERLRESGEVDVEQVHKVSGPALGIAVSLSEVTQNLTRKQMDSLRTAVAAGYYDTPRRAYADELAGEMGMARSTFQEHLQKAEAAVMKTFVTTILEHPGLDEQAVKGRGRPRVKSAAV